MTGPAFKAGAAPVLNRRLVLEEAQRAADGAGGFVTEWSALGTVWASVTAGTGAERAGEFVTLSSVPYRITVRGRRPARPRAPGRISGCARAPVCSASSR